MRVFDDPQTVVGAVIGLLIIIGGTTVAVLGHVRREKAAAEDGEGPPV